MCVAAVTGVGGDDGLVARVLERGVLELVCAWPPAKHWFLFEHLNGRCPAVDPLHV